jgi:hypothetical protein
MKSFNILSTPILFGLGLLIAGTSVAPRVAAQGSLIPPGAPGPSMKSLQQVYEKLDARTAITNTTTTCVISTPGSYYLTTNLTVSSGNGVMINVNGVTLDLNGFTISSTAVPANYSAVSLNGGVLGSIRDVTILNGHVLSGVTNDANGAYTGSGFANGISTSTGSSTNVLVSRLTVRGISGTGINLGFGESGVVESCSVMTCGSMGIRAAIVRDSTAIQCDATAIDGRMISNCRGTSRAGNGVSGVTVMNSTGFSWSLSGVVAETVENCSGQTVTGTGVDGTTVINCRGESSGNGTGLKAIMANSCYGKSTYGTGLSANYGNFCFGSSVVVGTKYNMP